MLQLSLSAHPSSAAEARRFAADVLREWQEDPLSDPVVLLVSELVTNAVLHAGSPVQVALWRRGGHIHVDVVDQSPVMPGVRDYDDEATTGRGMELVETIAESWGVEPRHPRGKAVWFELPSTHAGEDDQADDAPLIQPQRADTATVDDTVTVRLLGAPVRLFPVMQQHTDALLREYTLMSMQSSEAVPPRLAVDLNPLTQQVTAATAAGSTTTELLVDVPVAARKTLLEVSEVLERADALAANGRLLHTPPLPEVRGCRDWFFDQMLSQIDGDDPDPWVITMATDRVELGGDIDFRRVVDELDDAVILADDRNRMIFANAAVEQVLGWSPDELAGRRLTTIIPERLREAHIAGYTRYLVTREARLIGNPVRVPARRRDGSEIEVQLTLHTFRPPGSRQMFLGVLHVPQEDEDREADLGAALALLDILSMQLAAGRRDTAALLADVGGALGRRFGAWWVVEENRLRCGAVWTTDASAYRRFRDATLQRKFEAGEGLPGRVWSTGVPEWIPDVVADANFPRVALAVEHQLRTACAFPVLVGDEVVGIVELFGEAVEPRDPAMLRALATAGRILGLGRS